MPVKDLGLRSGIDVDRIRDYLGEPSVVRPPKRSMEYLPEPVEELELSSVLKQQREDRL